MVLVDLYYCEDVLGKKIWFLFIEVSIEKDDKGCIVKVWLIVDGEEVIYGGMMKMFKLKNNGIDL